MQSHTKLIYLIGILVLVIGLSACNTGGNESPGNQGTQQVPSSTEGSPVGAPPGLDILPGGTPGSLEDAWAGSPHATTYVTDELGRNSTCAYCHAPTNFIPSMDDMPESCAACKFEVDPPPPTIAESDWASVPCNVCHRLKKGEVLPEIAWLLIPPIDEYEEVGSPKELCLKCHAKTDVPNHLEPELLQAHADYDCTQCHDAHTTAATCSSSLCHPDVTGASVTLAGHDNDHEMVACWTCHDGAGLEIGMDDLGNWVTLIPGGLRPYSSHNIVKQAACERCHFAGNSWGLTTDTSGSTP